MGKKKTKKPVAPAAGRPESQAPTTAPTRRRLVPWITTAAVALLLLLVFVVRPLFRRRLPPPLNVLVVTLDTTRADRIGAFGCREAETPNLDRLAREGVRFTNAYSTVPLTLAAHCSIFTGTYPPYHGVRNNGNYQLTPQITTLAEIFKERGYTTAAFISSFTVDSRFGLKQGFDVYNDDLAGPKKLKLYQSERRAEPTSRLFSDWLGTHSTEKFFAWVHFYDPHTPYDPPEPFRSRFRANPYDGEIAYMDEWFGHITERLRELGLLDSTLIVVVGDHGEAMGEHGEYGHQIFCYRENLQVPLFFYGAERFRQGGEIHGRVSMIDIAPTILEVLGLPRPAVMQGISLVSALHGEEPPERPIYFESLFAKENMGCAALTGMFKGEYKFIDLPKPELFDTNKDQAERNNLVSKHGPLAQRMKQELHEMARKLGGGNFNSGRTLSNEDRQILATLGYIGATNTVVQGENLPDPKDRIDAFSDFFQANEFMARNRYAEAEAAFRRAIVRNPNYAASYGNLSNLLSRMHRPADALETLRQGIIANPMEPTLRISYITQLMEMGRLDDALAFAQKTEKESGGDIIVKLYTQFAEIYEKKGDSAKALAYYEKARAIEPDNPTLLRSMAFLLHNTNRLAAARELYERLERLLPDDGGLLQDIAILYAQSGDWSRAESYFERAAAGKPSQDLYFDYAIAMAMKKDWRKAAQLMERFLAECPPDNPKAAEGRARLAQIRANL